LRRTYFSKYWDGVINIEDRDFNNYSVLSHINILADNPKFMSIDGVIFNKDAETLIIFPAGKAENYMIPNTVTVIEDNAFSN